MYFNFKRLINKYSTTFTALTPPQSGFNTKGDHIEGEPVKTTLEGAIIRHRENKVIRSDGAFTSKDYALYMLTEPAFDLIGSIVHYEGERFRVDSKLDNSKFTGVWAYNLKYLSAFEVKK